MNDDFQKSLSTAPQEVRDLIAQAPVGIFHRKDDLVLWLRAASDAYGSTLQPDGETGVVGLDPQLPHAQRVDIIRRGFGPINYDDDKSIEDHVSAAVNALGRQLQNSLSFDAHLRIQENVRDAILEALWRWRSGDGEHVLYVLLGVALRFDVKDASNVALDLLARGQLATSSDAWKKALGVRLSDLGREQARQSSSAAQLLEELHDRADYWSPRMLGNITGGLAVARQRAWKPMFLHHLEQVEQMKPREQRVQFGRIADAVGPRDFIVDCLSIVPTAYGWDGKEFPGSAKKEHRLFKAILEPCSSPFQLDREPSEPQFVRRDIQIDLKTAAYDEQVVDQFKRLAPAHDLDVIDMEFSHITCREKVDDLRPPAAIDAQDPFGFLEFPETEFINETGMYASEPDA